MTLLSCKRCLLVILFTSLLGSNAWPQVKFGLKAGLTFSEMLASKEQTATISSISMTMINFPRTNVNAGAYFDIPVFGKLHLQPEVLYNNQGSYSLPRHSYVISATETYKLKYLSFPLLLKWHLPYYTYFATGPQFGLLLDAKIDQALLDKERTYSVKSQYKPNDFGWVLAIGYMSPVNIGIDVRYYLGFKDINNATATSAATLPVQNGRFRNSGLQIDIFFQFGRNRLPPSSPGFDQ